MCIFCFSFPPVMLFELVIFIGSAYLLGEYSFAGQVASASVFGGLTGWHLSKRKNFVNWVANSKLGQKMKVERCEVCSNG